MDLSNQCNQAHGIYGYMSDPVMRTEVVENLALFDLFEANLRETHESEVRKRGNIRHMRTELAILAKIRIGHTTAYAVGLT